MLAQNQPALPYNAPMNRRFVVVASAALLAGLVLVASIVMGPPNLRDGPDLPGADLDAATSDSASDVTYTILQRGDSDDDITRTVLRADRLQRLDRGVSRFTRPRAEMRYSPTRAMTLSADSADVIMVKDQPQRGTFTGNVVITLYEAPPGQPLIMDPQDPRHLGFVRLRIFLDDQTNFDLATNDIDTPGPVHVTARETDFFGRGLRLKYNSRLKRIEQLVINQGAYLMYNPEAQTAAIDEEQPAPSPEDPDTPSPPSQYYLATFKSQVLVREGNRSELFGDEQLDLRFSLGQQAITPPNPIRPGEDDAAPQGSLLPAIPGWQLAQAGETATDTPTQTLPTPAQPSTPQAQPEQSEGSDQATNPADEESQPVDPAPLGRNGQPVPGLLAQPVTIPLVNSVRSMFEHDPDRDIVVTWSGQLRLIPLSEKPDALADDNDVQFQLKGPNAYAQTTRDGRTDRMEAGEIEYLLASQLVNAIAPEGRPVRIVSSTIGSLEGSSITLDQQTGVGVILGPGSITQLPDDEGKALNLAWSDRLELRLYTQALASDPVPLSGDLSQAPDAERPGPAEDDAPVLTRDGQVRVTGLQSARFIGNVVATHPDFDCTSEELTLDFREPDELAKRKNDPFRINAAGNVTVHAQGDAEDERFAITAQSLTINLENDERGEVYASSMRALIDVKIERPGNTLTCRQVDVALAPPVTAQPQDPDEEPAENNKPYAEVRTLLAQGTVMAELDYDGRRVDLAGDRLVADVELDQLTLIANNDRNLAEVYDLDDDRKLSGKLIVMDDQAEQVRVDGPGILAVGLEDPDLAAARLAVAWQRAMNFDNIKSTARFVGQVNATTSRSTDQTELSSDTLDLRFSPDPEHDPRNLLSGDDQRQPDADGALSGGGREVRSAIATGNVRFIASAFETNQPGKPYNRVHIEGPILTFTNRPRTSPTAVPVETLTVDGPGVMLIEDYRPRDQPDDQDAQPQTRVSFTGRGATAFKWQDSMTLDARSNTATFVNQVRMIHRPREDDDTDGPVVRLYADRLVSDMEDGGGLGVWLSDQAPDARITTVNADHAVRIVHEGRELLGDHLQYTADDQVAELWADEGKRVNIIDTNSGNESSAARAIWDLAKDRIDLRDTAGGTIGG